MSTARNTRSVSRVRSTNKARRYSRNIGEKRRISIENDATDRSDDREDIADVSTRREPVSSKRYIPRRRISDEDITEKIIVPARRSRFENSGNRKRLIENDATDSSDGQEDLQPISRKEARGPSPNRSSLDTEETEETEETEDTGKTDKVGRKTISRDINTPTQSTESREDIGEILFDARDPEDGPRFRIQNKKVHLTYATHIDPEEWLEWARNTKELDIVKYSIVNETGEDDYEHTHILIAMSKIIQTTSVRYFDYVGLHPHIRAITNNTHWNRVVKYHSKQNEPYTNIKSTNLAQKIWAYDSESEMLEDYVTSTKEVAGASMLWSKKKANYGEPPDVTWRPWQKQLRDELGTDPDSRKIIWYWDPIGNSGKTFYSRYAGMYDEAFITTGSNIYHLATTLQEAMSMSEALKIVIFNFTRQTETHKVYRGIENVKDGLVTSEKYKGKTMIFDPPHIVVFANYIPCFEQFSLDRWCFRIISQDGMRVEKEWKSNNIRKWMKLWLRDEIKEVKEIGEIDEDDPEYPNERLASEALRSWMISKYSIDEEPVDDEECEEYEEFVVNKNRSNEARKKRDMVYRRGGSTLDVLYKR